MSNAVTPELTHPKRTGDAVESNQFEALPQLEPVTDRKAEWHDAVTVDIIDGTAPVYLGGVCLVERDVQVEIKGACYTISNGDGTDRSGRFTFRSGQHEQLVDAGGAYLLVVYAPEPGVPTLARLLVPAVLVDDIIDERWTEMGDDHAESGRKTLAWTTFLKEDKLERCQHGY